MNSHQLDVSAIRAATARTALAGFLPPGAGVDIRRAAQSKISKPSSTGLRRSSMSKVSKITRPEIG